MSVFPTTLLLSLAELGLAFVILSPAEVEISDCLSRKGDVDAEKRVGASIRFCARRRGRVAGNAHIAAQGADFYARLFGAQRGVCRVKLNQKAPDG